MNYPTGEKVKIGDQVTADGMSGLVVCDFDNREFLEGYEGWDTPELEMQGGAKLLSGVLINTKEAGFIHYPEEDEGVVRRPSP